MRTQPEEMLGQLIQENYFVAAICVMVGTVFTILGWLWPTDAPDPQQVAFFGGGFFYLIAILYGLQGLSMRRRLNRALAERDGKR